MSPAPLATYYDGRRGTRSNGQNYENKMGALLYLRAVNLTQGQVEAAAAARAETGAGAGAAGPALRLGLNVAWAGKFDDVVLLLAGTSAAAGGERDDDDDGEDDDVDDGSRQLLMQLKHRERRQVTRALLAGNNADFGVRKYFESYCAVLSAPQVRAGALRCVLYTNASVEVHGAPRDADFERLFVQLLNTGGSAGRLAQLDPVKDAAVCAAFAGEPRADDFRRQFFVCSQQAREDELDELLQQELALTFGRVLPDARDLPRRLVEALEALGRLTEAAVAASTAAAAAAPSGALAAASAATTDGAAPRVPFLTEAWAVWRAAEAAARAAHGALGRARLGPQGVAALAEPVLDARAALLETPGADPRLRSAALLQVGLQQLASAKEAGARPLLVDAGRLLAAAAEAATAGPGAPRRKTALDLWSGSRHCTLLLDAHHLHSPSGVGVGGGGGPCAEGAAAELGRRLARLLREDGARRLLVASDGDGDGDGDGVGVGGECACGGALVAALRRALASRELRVARHRLTIADLDAPAQDALLDTCVVFQGQPVALRELCGASALARWLPPSELCALLLASSAAAAAAGGDAGAEGGARAAPCVGAEPPAECAHFLARRCEARVHLHNELFLRDERALPDAVLVQGLGADELSALYARPLLRSGGAAGPGAALTASCGSGGDGGVGGRRAPVRDPRFHAAVRLEESDWEEFCARNPSHPAHWLSYEAGGHFRWLRSRGSTQALHDFTLEDDKNAEGARWILQLGTSTPGVDDLLHHWMSNLATESADAEEGVPSAMSPAPALVLEAGPGAGKTAFLRRAARRARALYPRCWALLLDLAAAPATAALAAGGAAARWDALLALAAHGHHAQGQGQGQAAADARCARFAHALRRSAPMLALVDAFDEVCPDYASAALEVLRALRARPRCAVWVATRPSARARLDAALGASCSLSLRPLPTEQQLELLGRLVPSSAHHHIHDAVRGLANDRDNGGVLGAPLHVELLAEALAAGEGDADGAGAEDDEEDEDDEDGGGGGGGGDAGAPRGRRRRRRPRFVDLVERLVQRKFEVYCCEKLRKDPTFPAVRLEMEATLRPLFLEEHGLAALSAVLGREEQAAVGLPQHEARLRAFLLKVERGEERSGVLVGAEGGAARFAHRTLAEYLAARWLAERPAAARALLGAAEHAPLRSFLDALLARGRPLHEALLDGAPYKRLRRLLERKPHLVAQTDRGGRTALHLAAQRGGFTELRSLIKAGAPLEEVDQVLGSTALYYAVLAQRWAEARLLLVVGARVRQEERAEACVRAVLSAAARAWSEGDPDTCPAPDALLAAGGVPEPTWPVLRVPAPHPAASAHDTAAHAADAQARTSVLHLAAGMGLDAQVKQLLSLGADVNARNSWGDCPLHAAARGGRLGVASLLLEAGAAPDARNAAGEAPLAAAARAAAINAEDGRTRRQSRCRRIAQLLLRAGANAEAVDARGYAALHWAASGGDWRLVLALLRAQAPSGAANAEGHTPLHLAALEGRLRVVSLLLSGSAPSSPWALLGLWTTPALHAWKQRRKTLLHGRRLRMFNPYRARPHSQDSQVALARRASDGPQEAASAQPDSPLHLAAQQGHAAVAAELLRTGADPNAAGARGSTPLHQATVSGHVAAMRVLLEAGADPNAEDAFGERPLHNAAYGDHAEAVQLLAAGGARLDAQAAEAAGGARPLHHAARRGALAATRALLQAGALIDARDGKGETALHAATRAARVETATELLQAGADANARSLKGLTPLHCAVKASSAALGQLLLRAGADVLARDASGRSPLALAQAHARQNGHGPAHAQEPGRRDREHELWRRDSDQLLRALRAAVVQLKGDAAAVEEVERHSENGVRPEEVAS